MFCVKAENVVSRDLGSGPGSVSDPLHDLGPVVSVLWASVSSFVQ